MNVNAIACIMHIWMYICIEYNIVYLLFQAAVVKREKRKTRGKGVLAKRLVRKQKQHVEKEKVSGRR